MGMESSKDGGKHLAGTLGVRADNGSGTCSMRRTRTGAEGAPDRMRKPDVSFIRRGRLARAIDPHRPLSDPARFGCRGVTNDLFYES